MSTVKEVLEEKEIKQIWLAEKPSKSCNTVNCYVKKRRQPRLETLMSITDVLDIGVKYLIISNRDNEGK